MYKEDCNLADYIRLYNSGVSIFDLKKEKLLTNKEYVAYISKDYANPIKLVSYKQSFSIIPYDPAMFHFYKNHDLFWMIPLETIEGLIIGFIFRSFFDKAYRTISFSEFSIPYGLGNFGNFNINDPIILIEGTRDCIFSQKIIYPYSLSINMAKISLDLIAILTKFSNKFIYIPDTDPTGFETSKHNQNLFKEVSMEKDPREFETDQHYSGCRYCHIAFPSIEKRRQCWCCIICKIGCSIDP